MYSDIGEPGITIGRVRVYILVYKGVYAFIYTFQSVVRRAEEVV